METKIKIFLSWSKIKSKKLAEITKEFIKNTIGDAIEFFFSPEMYKGTCVDNEIHKNLINCNMCLVFITADNFKNPWLMYESGVIFGANHAQIDDSVVIPILFERIPEWSSWIDKPLNRYVPIQMEDYNREFSIGKRDFEDFLKNLSKRLNTSIYNFEANWDIFEKQVKSILSEHEYIPRDCKYIVNTLLKHSETFTVNSPEIFEDKILFHQGFTTNSLTKILINAMVMDHNNILWIYGRKNKKLLSRENEPFFKYLADEGLANKKDFRCLFPMPNSNATMKASSRDRASDFDSELKISLKQAVSLKNKYGLPIEKVFRLYMEPRTESFIRLDNAVLHRKITRDIEGYPLPYTNSEFEICSINSTKGTKLSKNFELIWNDETKSIPLTEELFEIIYGLRR